MPTAGNEPSAAAVIVPVKAFRLAKVRLAPALSATERDDLARRMAEQVVGAAAPLPVAVVCDDDDVRAWAEAHGARVRLVPGPWPERCGRGRGGGRSPPRAWTA